MTNDETTGMTLTEAIKILNLKYHDTFLLEELDTRDALKLGIEAMKHIKAWRHDPPTYGVNLLPGEIE